MRRFSSSNRSARDMPFALAPGDVGRKPWVGVASRWFDAMACPGPAKDGFEPELMLRGYAPFGGRDMPLGRDEEIVKNIAPTCETCYNTPMPSA